MSNTIQLLANHWADIIAVGAAVHGLALVIVNLTPSETDNRIYNKVYKVIEVAAGLMTKMAKKWTNKGQLDSSISLTFATNPSLKVQSIYNRHNPNPDWEYGVGSSAYPENERKEYREWIKLIDQKRREQQKREQAWYSFRYLVYKPLKL